jgi:hypothetical protein
MVATTASSLVEGNRRCVPTVRDWVKVVPTPVIVVHADVVVVVTVPICVLV